MAAIKTISAESKKKISQIYHGTNCGLAIYGFPWHNAKDEGEGGSACSWAWFRKHFDPTGYLNQLIVFSGNSNQKGPHGPHALAEWLKKQGEKVLDSKWVSGSHGGQIRAYVWHPSMKFRKKLLFGPRTKWGD